MTKDPMTMIRTIRSIAGAAVAATLVLPAAAGAHVTVQPPSAPAGAYVVENIRVPNERENAATTKVEVQFPDGFASVSYAPVAGWEVTVRTAKLAAPIETDDGEVTEGVKTVTWTAVGENGIEPGQFLDFPISVKVPGEAGDALTFKALQTYGDGEVVRWIGTGDSDKPAPVLAVTAAEDDPHATADADAEQDQDLHSEQTQEATTAPAASAAPAGQDDDEDDDSDGLAVIALVVGGLGLAAGGLALTTARRKGSSAT
jgi:uncharacterized protein